MMARAGFAAPTDEVRQKKVKKIAAVGDVR
jgi:hypothetical protein